MLAVELVVTNDEFDVVVVEFTKEEGVTDCDEEILAEFVEDVGEWLDNGIWLFLLLLIDEPFEIAFTEWFSDVLEWCCDDCCWLIRILFDII